MRVRWTPPPYSTMSSCISILVTTGAMGRKKEIESRLGSVIRGRRLNLPKILWIYFQMKAKPYGLYCIFFSLYLLIINKMQREATFLFWQENLQEDYQYGMFNTTDRRSLTLSSIQSSFLRGDYAPSHFPGYPRTPNCSRNYLVTLARYRMRNQTVTGGIISTISSNRVKRINNSL